MTRRECLDKAAECVLQDRASQYGGPEDNFGRIAKLWSTYTGTVLDGIDVAMMMSLLKVARIRNNKDYSDGYIDLAGYAACGAELAGAAKAGGECRKLGAEAEPDMFPAGTPVEVKSGAHWVAAKYMNRSGDFHLVRMPDSGMEVFPPAMIRHAPKAEGCEELVEKDAPLCGERCEEFIPGLGTCESCRHAREQDAPQTPAELYDRIIANNLVTYGTPHKPTGEELAEMAEEDAHE